MDLLPCPFCGGEALGPQRQTLARNIWFVACKSCDARQTGTAGTNPEQGKQSAIRSWNHRPAADTIAQLVKERDEARATNCRLHRRVQQDEGRVFRKAFRLAEAGWDSTIVKWVHEKVAAESRASKAEAEAATLREALGALLRCEYESASHGLLDCIDNDGGHYQSAFLAEQIKKAEALLGSRARTQQHGAKE